MGGPVVTKSNKWYGISILLGILVVASSLLGIIDPKIYSQETENWKLQAIGQDIGNLFAVIVFIFSTHFSRKGSRFAFFVWTGSHLYFIYAFLLYAFFVHFNYLFLVYVLILSLSFFSLLAGWIKIDYSPSMHQTPQKWSKITGVFLIGVACLFGILWLSEIIPAIISGKTPESALLAGLLVNPVQVIDLAFVLPGMLITGVQLWNQKTLGFLFSIPWLSFAALMGLSLMTVMVIELGNDNMNALPSLILMGIIVIFSLILAVSMKKHGPEDNWENQLGTQYYTSRIGDRQK
ncbi:hypothetical protein QWY93_02850 [Echinicola jeungdonensis]|uniref:Uncharacterized protein n=1 Tax=Echinicola jeungdonensis TaxID=709343 RepID=A0ABV5J0T6_9BACT|nr:hypothetical protein [Echinicola jeungdonensis]MDN3668267.1 hypothetical protein [Echinicola jeungdonensis]